MTHWETCGETPSDQSEKQRDTVESLSQALPSGASDFRRSTRSAQEFFQTEKPIAGTERADRLQVGVRVAFQQLGDVGL